MGPRASSLSTVNSGGRFRQTQICQRLSELLKMKSSATVTRRPFMVLDDNTIIRQESNADYNPYPRSQTSSFISSLVNDLKNEGIEPSIILKRNSEHSMQLSGRTAYRSVNLEQLKMMTADELPSPKDFIKRRKLNAKPAPQDIMTKHRNYIQKMFSSPAWSSYFELGTKTPQSSCAVTSDTDDSPILMSSPNTTEIQTDLIEDFEEKFNSAFNDAFKLRQQIPHLQPNSPFLTEQIQRHMSSYDI